MPFFIEPDYIEYSWLVDYPIYPIAHDFVSSQFRIVGTEIIDLEAKNLTYLFMTSMFTSRSDEMIDKEISFFKNQNIEEYKLVINLQNSLITKYESEYQILSDKLTFLLIRVIISLKRTELRTNKMNVRKYLRHERVREPNFYYFLKDEIIKQMGSMYTLQEMELILARIIPLLKANIPVMKYEKPLKIGFFYDSDITEQYLVQNEIVERLNKRISFETNERELTNMDIVIVDEKSYMGVKRRISDSVSIIFVDNIAKDNSIQKLEFAIDNIKE